ncbi:efflux transporter outer membrane subunit [Glaciecola sp. MH2013]|uniref:TolC family protein n=1 Tax=Glaciecola sp. MH2013 TaxID=2785524 RepID=UPI00189EFD61|nr:efflux transporter outer membrane subunit [Glaciecola sp. MH2013]MBF7074498.1 efflux transporter outer membrane subunit [Glaciecola sp. MH2013]
MRLIVIYCVILISACSHTSSISESDKTAAAPEQWQENWQREALGHLSEASLASSKTYWPLQYSNEQLADFTQQALGNNFSLQQTTLSVAIQEKRLNNAQASLLPTLDLGFSSRRQQNTTQLTSTNTLELSSNYELDLWGKLSAQEKAQSYELLAAKANLQQQTQNLVANLLTAYATAVEASQLYDLFKRRSNNSQQGLRIIEDGYKQGLNTALDVYLARNELNTDLAREAQQQTVKLASIRSLEQLLGRYPTGVLALSNSIPIISNDIYLGVPANMLMNKPNIQAAWLNLLAKDATLAFAHKQRFPSFTLAASLGSSTDKLKDLFSSDLVWTLLGSIVAPLYDAGTLANNEDIARLEVQQTELQYWETVNSAFADVENGLSQERNLQQRVVNLSEAEENAIAAEALAFEQYLKGLVTYTTVLEAQTRATEAQSTLIQVKRELFTNRVNLHLALGSNFDPALQPSINISERNND